MQLTKEQAYIDANIRPNKMDVIAIEAFAGCGKTFILQHVAKKFPHLRMLYLAYNKSIIQEAGGKFPRNVDCKTTHSLAYGRFGAPFRHKLNKQARKITFKSFLAEAKHPLEGVFEKSTSNTQWAVTNLVLDTFESYLYSADKDIMPHHVDTARKASVPVELSFQEVVASAKVLWKAMTDVKHPLPMMHDCYLKMYQLSEPDLSQYDIILFDEAQDANPSTQDIVDRQATCKIYVGDPHQQIYAFRGGDNAFDNIQPTQTYKLTQSFRFGPTIAGVATKILTGMKGVSTPVRGMDAIEDSLVPTQSNLHEGCTVLARTNAELFDKACMWLDKISFGYQGGLKREQLQDIMDVYYIWAGEQEHIRNGFFKNYREFDHLIAYARAAEDIAVGYLCGIVNKYKTKIPYNVEQVLQQNRPERSAHIILCTAHKSKGLEWDNVVLCGDFVKTLDPESGHVKDDEINLFYVACTRAQKNLAMHKDLADFYKTIEL